MRTWLICACAASLASTALAESATAPVVADPSTNKPNAPAPLVGEKPQAAIEKKICRNIEVGFSHRSERVCMTAKQWEAYDRGE
jgi:hypothetical protein